MPKRNIVWIAVVTVIAVGLWQIPEIVARRDVLYNQFGPLLDVSVQIRKKYVEPADEQDLMRGAIDGMLGRLDPYCTYYDPHQYEQFCKRTDGQFSGIGINVWRAGTGELLVVSPIEGSPAFLAGLRSGDLITQVNGIQTTDLRNLADGVDLIVGDPGTTVRLTVYRPSTAEVLEKTVTRGLVTVPTVRGWARSADWQWDYMIDHPRRIGYVRILSFDGNTAAQFHEVVRPLLARDRMAGLILDVRDNPGGLLEVVVEIADRFLAEGLIVSTQGRNSTEERYPARPERTYPPFPMVVLVNHGSASASEILAGALRDHRRATVLGEPTFGKGSVQELITLGDENGSEGAIKLTTAYYYLPSGERIHGTGVMPDRIVEMSAEQREAMLAAQRAVYATGVNPTTVPTTAPAWVEIAIDPQLEAGLDILRKQLATRPGG